MKKDADKSESGREISFSLRFTLIIPFLARLLLAQCQLLKIIFQIISSSFAMS